MAYNNSYPSNNKRADHGTNRNEWIKAPKVLVIDDSGEKLGVMDTKEALELARSKELDLIEVSPNTVPPVCKITDWNKLQYEKSKKQKHGSHKAPEIKGMRFTPFIGAGDMAHKLKRTREFLAKKHPMKLFVMAKGRTTRENIENVMNKVLQELEGEIEFQDRPKFEGRNLSILVYPKKK